MAPSAELQPGEGLHCDRVDGNRSDVADERSAVAGRQLDADARVKTRQIAPFEGTADPGIDRPRLCHL